MNQHFPHIDGATPLNDYSGLIPNWVHTLGDLNRAEAENILIAQLKYLKKPTSARNHQKWFCTDVLRAIHQTMFGKVWKWAGTYRKSVTSIGIKPSLIPVQLAEACYEVVNWMRYPVELTFVEMAARIHHRLVLIHPFENGNGRFSRLVADRFLFGWKCAYPTWPEHLNHENSVRRDYIYTLRCADRGDYSPLIDFMRMLGARDPTINELLSDLHYRNYIQKDEGVSIVRALLRGQLDADATPTDYHPLIQLASKHHMEGIAKLLASHISHMEKQKVGVFTRGPVCPQTGCSAIPEIGERS